MIRSSKVSSISHILKYLLNHELQFSSINKCQVYFQYYQMRQEDFSMHCKMNAKVF